MSLQGNIGSVGGSAGFGSADPQPITPEECERFLGSDGKEILPQISSLKEAAQIDALLEYEKKNSNRAIVVKALEKQLQSSDVGGVTHVKEDEEPEIITLKPSGYNPETGKYTLKIE